MPLDLEALDKMHDKAARGPWYSGDTGGFIFTDAAGAFADLVCSCNGIIGKPSKDFIVNAHNSWPEISALLKLQARQVEKAKILSEAAQGLIVEYVDIATRDIPTIHAGVTVERALIDAMIDFHASLDEEGK